ncbi:GFA family protein [Pikeienuella piscinae]|uniref:GFA family protein n=1 Tax=Pikeienuella piscinae TaxID=2748098 RepID=A0A7L5BTZ7_9RHOB|nr:GFA family protein [Pikeienuella piscinae]QIE55012.1 GFA family protein [Pikeienuella piscinae]
MTEETRLEGGCLCGALRYRIDGAPRIVSTCHCGMCRRASGAPFVIWMTVLKDRVTFEGAPRWRESSESGARGFCAACGTHVAARSDHYERYYDIPAGTLDEPAAAPPQRHVFAAFRLPWVALDDGLPAYEEDARSALIVTASTP